METGVRIGEPMLHLAQRKAVSGNPLSLGIGEKCPLGHKQSPMGRKKVRRSAGGRRSTNNLGRERERVLEKKEGAAYGDAGVREKL